MSRKTFPIRPLIVTGVAALSALALGGLFGYGTGQLGSTIRSAQAQEDSGGSGKGARGPSGEHGYKGTKAPSEVGGRGQGQGGPDDTSDAKGPRYGGGGSQPAPGTQGGKPVWAQEGIPSDLELGRLNVARSPSHVLDRSLATALAALSPTFYDAVIAVANSNKTLEEKIADLKAVVALSFTDASYVRIDSPLENLALYKDLLTDLTLAATSKTYTTSTTEALFLAAVFLGSASDKTIPVSTATVDAVTKLLSVTLPAGITADQLGTLAEAVRVQISTSHGE